MLKMKRRSILSSSNLVLKRRLWFAISATVIVYISHNFHFLTDNPNTLPSKNIPRNILINSKDGMENLPPLIRTNIQSNIALFPGWRVISDDDNTCKKKIHEAYGLISSGTSRSASSLVEGWYNNPTIEGKFKSDFCRLAQLYLDGGVYMDNDLELTSSLGGILEQDVDVITVLTRDEDVLFQALLGTSQGHYLTQHSLELFRDHVEGKKRIEGYNLGPTALMTSLRELYNITGGIDRNHLLNEKIYLFKEVKLPTSHPMMKDRFADGGACEYAFEGILDDRQWKRNEAPAVPPLYGFSRVKKFDTSDAPCRKGL